MAQKHKKKLITTATEQFNAKPSKGIAYMQECGLIKTPVDNAEVAAFMRQNPHLDKKQIGEYISNRKNLAVLEAFFDRLIRALAAHLAIVPQKISERDCSSKRCFAALVGGNTSLQRFMLRRFLLPALLYSAACTDSLPPASLTATSQATEDMEALQHQIHRKITVGKASTQLMVHL